MKQHNSTITMLRATCYYLQTVLHVDIDIQEKIDVGHY